MSLTDLAVVRLGQPLSLRCWVVRKLLSRFPVGSFEARLRAGAMERPWYGWCMYYGAIEAKALGHKAMTVIEFGVAGGNGLVCLCKLREEVAALLDIDIRILGFDTGRGLPPSQEPRDLLYCWPAGSFEMDRARLEKRLGGRAELVIGDVSETVAGWEASPEAPLGAVMFDLDYYSSTAAALRVLSKKNILPRVWCYMDDILGYYDNAFTDNIGVRAAIKEFNAMPERALLEDHLLQAYSFLGLQPEEWHQQMYAYHRLTHPAYNICLSQKKHQLELN